MPQRLFIFIQMEFPWALGPADGRYLLRLETNGEPERVVVLGTLGAGRAQSAPRGPRVLARMGARATGVPAAPDPAEVTTSRVTVIDPVPLSAEQQARAWLEDFDRERDVLAAVGVVNRVLHAHRIASADPYVHEVSPAQALVIRAGWGEGEQVAGGRWLHARELPWAAQGRASGRRRARSSSVLRPQERLAALLGARAGMLLCEELTLRARLDLDQGRLRHAALELDSAFLTAVPELRQEGRQDLAIRIAELDQLQPGVAEQRRLALADGEADPDEEALSHALGRLEAALRARTAPGVSLK
ncbi:MAG: hypothetical protein ACYDHN_12640 [Solirubrobacteraceae bacterium]